MLAKLAEMLLAFTINSLCIYIYIYMQTTVILFQTPKLGNITRIIYYKNLNSWELFEIMLTKNLCSYSHNLLQTLENL